MNRSMSESMSLLNVLVDFIIQSSPQYCHYVDRLPPIMPLIFKSRMCSYVFLVNVGMTPFAASSNTAVFLPVPRAAVLGGGVD